MKDSQQKNLNSVTVLNLCVLVSSGIAAIGLINEALAEGDLQKTMAALQNPAAKLTDIDPSLAQHYYDILQEARREKAHVRKPLKTSKTLISESVEAHKSTLLGCVEYIRNPFKGSPGCEKGM